jgi:hypothetical protein
MWANDLRLFIDPPDPFLHRFGGGVAPASRANRSAFSRLLKKASRG